MGLSTQPCFTPSMEEIAAVMPPFIFTWYVTEAYMLRSKAVKFPTFIR